MTSTTDERLSVVLNKRGERLEFECPGCGQVHSLNTGPGRPHWDMTGTVDAPTFNPSVLMTSGHHVPSHKPGDRCWCTYKEENPDRPAPFQCVRCHLYVRSGKLVFLDDCTHHLKGQTVDMIPWDR